MNNLQKLDPESYLKDFDLSEGAPVFKLSIANGEMYHGNTAKNFKTALPFKFMGVKG